MKRAGTECLSVRTRPQEQRDEFAVKIEANPRNYIAQPTLALSRVPTLIGDHLEGTARGSAALHSLWQGYPRSAGRADARRSSQGLAGGEFIPGWREQGYLGPCGA